MLAATTSNDSVPQKSRSGVGAVVRSFTRVWQQQGSSPRSQRAHDSPPQDSAIKGLGHHVVEETSKAEALENTTSISRSSGEANWKNEQHASSSIHVVSPQIEAKSDKEVTPPAGWEGLGVAVNQSALVASSSQDTGGGTERHMGAPDTRRAQSGCEREGPDTPKPRPLSVDVSAGKKEQRASRGPFNLGPQGIYRFIPALVLRYTPGGSKVGKPTQAVSVERPATQPSSVDAKLPDSKTEELSQAISVPQPASQPSAVDDGLFDSKTEGSVQAVGAPQPATHLSFVDDELPNSKTKEPAQAISVSQPPLQPSSVGTELFRSETEPYEGKKPLSSPPPIRDNPRTMNTEDKERIARESEEIERLRSDLSGSNHEVAELRKRCEAQSRDLERSNSFFSAPDKSSDSDIIHALQRLNAEIQQNTMYMAESLAEDFGFSAVDTNLTKERGLATQRASEHIGQVLVQSLGTKTPEDIPMLLQIAFQAYLVSALYQAVSSWASEPAHTAFIDGIYRRLCKVEAQAISGRWRVLARVHIVHNCVSDSGTFVKAIIADLADILSAAGCTATRSDIISKISCKFEERMAMLVGLAGRLNKLFDDVISSDFEVFIVHPGEKFEEKKMEDTDEDQVGIQEGLVLCATHMGLIKRIPVGSLWERGRKREVMVLKAKVLPESSLNTEG